MKKKVVFFQLVDHANGSAFKHFFFPVLNSLHNKTDHSSRDKVVVPCRRMGCNRAECKIQILAENILSSGRI